MCQMFGDFCSAEIGPGHDKVQWEMDRRGCAGHAVMVTVSSFTWGIPPHAQHLQAVVLMLVGRAGMGCRTSTRVSHHD